MSDPRVLRGSVVAKQREERAERERHIKQQDADERFRTEIIRNRLSTTMMNNNSTALVKLKKTNSSYCKPLARLAGPIGHRAWDSMNNSSLIMENQQKIDYNKNNG